MSKQGKFEAEALAASLEFHEALRAFLEPYNLHAAIVCWAVGVGEHTAAASAVNFGCPHCGGAALAQTVYNLDPKWKDSFADAFRDQLQGRDKGCAHCHGAGPSRTPFEINFRGGAVRR